MLKPILLNNKQIHFSKEALPMLIDGKEGSGASLFSISIVADLFAQGHKLLFMSGYHMARGEFEHQASAEDSILIEHVSQFVQATTKQVVFVRRENTDVFVKLCAELTDIQERIIFLKNVELFGSAVLAAIQAHPNSVVAGDVDLYRFKDSLLSKRWQSTIHFSQSQTSIGTAVPKLIKYQGYLTQPNQSGIVSLG